MAERRKIGPIWQHFNNSRRYFAQFPRDIAEQNLSALKRVSVAGIVFTILFGGATTFLFQRSALLLSYGVLLLAMLMFGGWVLIYTKKKRCKLKTVQTACAVFLIILMGFVIHISVFVFPSQPAVFFAPFYLISSIIFIIQPVRRNLLLTGFAVLFFILAGGHKTPSAFTYDMFSGLTGWLFGVVVAHLNFGIYLREGEAKRRLRETGTTDTMMGIPNRRAFDEYLRKHLEGSEKNGKYLAVILIDIDDFKQYNDTFGHVAGDEALAKIGRIVRWFAAANDIFIARYGGEEIAAVLIDDHAQDAFFYADELVKEVRRRRIPRPDRLKPYITISAGTAVAAPGEVQHAAKLVDQADQALYIAKEQGKDRAVEYQKELRKVGIK